MFLTLWVEAIHSLAASRLRTGLTMMGMVIGVASVIIMVAVGQGSQRAVQKVIDALGSNLLIITPGNSSSKTGQVMLYGNLPIGDVDILRTLPILDDAAPVVWVFAQLKYRNRTLSSKIIGTSESYFRIRQLRVERGTSYSRNDVLLANRVAVIGGSTAHALFDQEDPIGRMVTLKGSRFEIVGVLASNGQSLDGQNQDDIVILPETTARLRLMERNKRDTVSIIYTRPVAGVSPSVATGYIGRMLRQSHNITPGSDDDFSIRDIKAVAEGAVRAGRVMTLLLGSIASISLVVGGIGIMNIMLVCVTERTREIGIRKALGASRSAIMRQFLYEAMLIALVGCLIGVMIGIAGTMIVESRFGVPVEISMLSVLVAFGVAVITGIFFGLYPARKAAMMRPAEALRYQ